MPPVDELIKEYEVERRAKENWEDTWEDVFKYCLPGRTRFFNDTNQIKGDPVDQDIYDETAVVGFQEFASRMHSGVTPRHSQWFSLVPGTNIPQEERLEIQAALNTVNDYAFQVLSSSHFDTAVYESYLDLACSSALMIAEETRDPIMPVDFRSVPLTNFVFGTGPFNEVDRVWILHHLRKSQIMTMFPDAMIPTEVMEAAETREMIVIEAVRRDWNERATPTYNYDVFMKTPNVVLKSDVFKGRFSAPTIPFRWSTSPAERYGRGPGMNALPAIKTVNLTMQLILENAEMALAGFWQTDNIQGAPVDNITVEPGTVIYKLPGSAGLESITPGGRFDLSQLVLDDMRHNIRKALFNETLGTRSGTPISAAEVDERTAELARNAGPAFGRIMSELGVNTVGRLLFVLKKKGLIELPVIDGREVDIVMTSPIARAKRFEDIQRRQAYLQSIGGLFGPQVVQTTQNVPRWVQDMAELYEIPPENLLSKSEQEDLARQTGEVLGEAQANGQDPSQIIGAALGSA